MARIYLIDDDQSGLEMKEEILTCLGFKVSGFTRFETAALGLSNERPDVIWSDFYSGQSQNGIEFWADYVVPKKIPFALWTGLTVNTMKPFSLHDLVSSQFLKNWLIFETRMQHEGVSIPLAYLENKGGKRKGLIPIFQKPCSIHLLLSYFQIEPSESKQVFKI
jgi:hypothetical protein